MFIFLTTPDLWKNFHFFDLSGPMKKCSLMWPPRTCEKMFIFLTSPELWKNVHFFDHPGPVKKF
jgi:hypothetical protein